MFGNLFGSSKYSVADQTQPSGQPQASVSLPFTPQSAQPGNVVGSTMDPSLRQGLSVLSHLDTRASQVLQVAQKEAKRIQQALIEPEQILYGLLFDGEVFKLISQFSSDPTKIVKEIEGKETMGQFTGEPTLSEPSKKIFEDAYSMVKKRGVEFISPEDILLTLFSQNISTANYLENQGIKKADLENKLSKNSSYVSGKKSALESYGIDLTEQAKKGELDPIAGRDKEIERVIHILLRRTKNNPIVIGEAGVGKTAIVEGLAKKIVDGSAPKDLLQKKIVQIDLSSLVAGASHRGEFEERLRSLIKETQAASGTVMLFIDEIHTLIGAGDTEGALDASNIVKPFLARGQLQIIGTTTTSEYRKHFEKDKAFERRFQPVIVAEPDEDTAVEMLNVLKPKYEEFHKVTFPAETLKAAVYLSKRYIGERYLPDKAVDLLDEAAAEVRLEQNEGKRSDNAVSRSDIERVVSSWTGIPITKLTENESEKLLHLEDAIHKRLINQEMAAKTVAEAVRRGRIGLSSANRPIASFVFLGPTGVGKTELAKTLGEILFGKEESMVRLDMSEYMEKHEVAKLIGAPPGYVGYEEGGQLTEAVRTKPYSIVLLDEIEKAHPDVFNILLQVLEDGRLTDNKGNTISFKNTIIIATSNIGSVLIQQQLESNKKNPARAGQDEHAETGKKFEELSKILLVELRKFFKPELLNRFDGVVIFEPLSQKNMNEVASLGIKATQKLLNQQGIDIAVTQEALAQLAKEGYDPIYGARPLRRLIQGAIENPIAILIINKTFVSGDKILINFDQTKQEFIFSKTTPTAQSSQGAPQNNPVSPQPISQPGIAQDGTQPTVPINGIYPQQPLQPNQPPAQRNDGTQMQPQT